MEELKGCVDKSIAESFESEQDMFAYLRGKYGAEVGEDIRKKVLDSTDPENGKSRKKAENR